jgi:two-component system response regulator MprA
MNELAVKVLVVEDDDEAAAAVASTLALCGYDVRVAADGRHAIDEARTFVPDVVVLDLGLPDRDGEEVALELRATLPPRAPIVVITGRTVAQQESLRAIDVILKKPIESSIFMTLISCARAKRSTFND